MQACSLTCGSPHVRWSERSVECMYVYHGMSAVHMLVVGEKRDSVSQAGYPSGHLVLYVALLHCSCSSLSTRLLCSGCCVAQLESQMW
jgi:hypothetical protein